MRTRCLPLNEEESRQTVAAAAAAAAEGVAHTVPVPVPVLLWQELSEKRRWQSHEILVNFQLQTNLFVFPAGERKKTPQHKNKAKQNKNIVTNLATKIGLKGKGAHSFRLVSSRLVWSGLLGSGLVCAQG